LDSNQGPIA